MSSSFGYVSEECVEEVQGHIEEQLLLPQPLQTPATSNSAMHFHQNHHQLQWMKVVVFLCPITINGTDMELCMSLVIRIRWHRLDQVSHTYRWIPAFSLRLSISLRLCPHTSTTQSP